MWNDPQASEHCKQSHMRHAMRGPEQKSRIFHETFIPHSCQSRRGPVQHLEVQDVAVGRQIQAKCTYEMELESIVAEHGSPAIVDSCSLDP